MHVDNARWREMGFDSIHDVIEMLPQAPGSTGYTAFVPRSSSPSSLATTVGTGYMSQGCCTTATARGLLSQARVVALSHQRIEGG